ncbi:MAG: hypothetical protein ACHQQQ_10390 [Bacteroidota bacterium]
MKWSYMSLVLLFTFALASITIASDKKGEKSMKSGTSKYIVITTHTEAECMNTLDKMSSDNKAFLGKTWFGCMSGDHTGYTIIDAKDEDAVKAMLPDDVKDKAKIVKVGMFTPSQIKKMHAEMEKTKS